MQIQYQLLTDPQWEVIKEKLPTQRKRKYDLRNIVNAIFWILRTCSHGVARRWRNLPKAFPKWQLVYYYFSKWKKDGTLPGLNNLLNMMLHKQVDKKATPSAVSIDTQTIKKAPFVSKHTGIDGNKMLNGRCPYRYD